MMTHLRGKCVKSGKNELIIIIVIKTMKKYFILLAAVALMAMTACNEKPAKNADAPATEQTDNGKAGTPKVNVEKAAPTEDGKDHTVAEFNTKEYQVRLENLADGTFRLSMWKAGEDKSSKPERLVETKKCVLQGKNYLMKDDDGNHYIITNADGKNEITIMSSNSIVYHGDNSGK